MHRTGKLPVRQVRLWHTSVPDHTCADTCANVPDAITIAHAIPDAWSEQWSRHRRAEHIDHDDEFPSCECNSDSGNDIEHHN